MTYIAGLLAQTCTSAAHQKIYNIVMAMCILSNLYSNVKIPRKFKTQKSKIGIGEVFL
jgi:hypothetical protein